MLYQEIILDHYKHPIGRGLRESFTRQASQHNPTCGDEVQIRVLITESRVVELSHETQGCSISQASASVLTEQVTNLSVDEAMNAIGNFFKLLRGQPAEGLTEDAAAFQGVRNYPARINCAFLPWKALEKALGESK